MCNGSGEFDVLELCSPITCTTCNGTGSVGSYEDVPELPKTEPTEFGIWMRKARERHGTSLIRLRDLTGISPSRLSEIERGAGEPVTEDEQRKIRDELEYLHRRIRKAESDAQVDAEFAEEDRQRQIRKSAPDLLAALKGIENRLYYIKAHDFYLSMPQDIIDQIKRSYDLVRAAIRKAEGRE